MLNNRVTGGDHRFTPYAALLIWEEESQVNIMSCQFRSYSGYAFAFLVGLTLIPGYQLLDRLGETSETAAENLTESHRPTAQVKDREKFVLTQAYSRTCSTARGSCGLPRPQPVGSDCRCGDEPGTVVR
jgi:hypothetical protein